MPSLAVPRVRLPGLHVADSTFDATVSEESAHTDTMAAALADAGFLGGAQRMLTGRPGVFSRVVIRGWVFSSAAGAASFASWLQTNAADLIGRFAPLHARVPGGVVVLLHRPTGCCHEEVPIYLSVAQRGDVVWTIQASGMKIHTAPVLALIGSTMKET
jgi:hypothetical protein